MTVGTNGFQSTLVLIATLNEEEGIGPTLSEINFFLEKPPCLIVDGKSNDGTVKIAESMGAQVIVKKDDGKGEAIATALESLKGHDFKYVIFIDADFTYPAEYIPQMIKLLEENPDVGMVCGNRFNGHFNLGNMHNILFFGNRLLCFVHNLFNGVQMRDPLTGLRVIRNEILKDWTPSSKSFDIEVELNHRVERKGYGILEIPIHYRRRLGKKKLKIKHGFVILKRILTESLKLN
jgi:dolichol-phosphate mannosyltransferase